MFDVKKEISTLILIVVSLIVLLPFFFDLPILNIIGTEMKVWAVILSGIAFGIGAINFVAYHSKKVIEKKKGSYINAWTLIVMVIVLILGLLPPIGDRSEFVWIYNAIILPGTNTTLSLLTFFIFSAASRSFIARDRKSGIFLLSGIFILFMNTPIITSILPSLLEFGQWILKVPSAAGFRAFTIATGLGTLSWAYRTIVGAEKGAELTAQ